MQYSLKYAAILLVAFSLALAAREWWPPLGAGALLIGLIVALRLFWNPPWLGWTVWGAVWGAVAFASLCFAASTAAGEPPVGRRDVGSHRWQEFARRYAIPLGGIAGGAARHGLFLWASKTEREEGGA